MSEEKYETRVLLMNDTLDFMVKECDGLLHLIDFSSYRIIYMHRSGMLHVFYHKDEVGFLEDAGMNLEEYYENGMHPISRLEGCGPIERHNESHYETIGDIDDEIYTLQRFREFSSQWFKDKDKYFLPDDEDLRPASKGVDIIPASGFSVGDRKELIEARNQPVE